MRHQSLPIVILTIACGLFAGVATAQARPDTWVSGTGTDTGTCVISAPCKTFAYAYTQTSNNGSINVLSSGSFGPLTITKPISIVAQGTQALITTGAGGAAITVQVGASDIVSLRGLTIDMRGTANDGIAFVSGAALHVQNCVIRRATFGIDFVPASGSSELHIADTIIGNSGDTNLNVVPSGSGDAKIVLNRVRLENAASHGIALSGSGTTGSIAATVHDSVIGGGSGTGISAFDAGGGTTRVMVDRSAILNNFHGVSVGGANTTLWIGNSTISGNSGIGFVSSGGASASYGTNKVNGNGTDGAATTSAAHK